MQERNWITVICISAVCLLLLGGCGRRKADLFTAQQGENIGTDIELSDAESEGDMLSEPSESAEQGPVEQNQMLAVYVCGAVQCPDVYYLEAGSIKQQALLAAGGFLEGAATEYVNLAEPVRDGEKLYFPYTDEIERTDVFDNTVSDDSEKQDGHAGKINLNTATREELMTLSGIGESKADAIIRYREEHGPFQSVEELMQVNGIKDGTYNNVKDYVIVN